MKINYLIFLLLLWGTTIQAMAMLAPDTLVFKVVPQSVIADNKLYFTLEGAINEINRIKNHATLGPVRFDLSEGIYFLEKPLIFDHALNAHPDFSLLIQSKSGKAILSGGKNLKPEKWTPGKRTKFGRIWKYALDDEEPNSVRQLFVNHQRIPRASSPYFTTNGPIDPYQIKRFDFAGIRALKQEDLLPFISFSSKEDKIKSLFDKFNAEIIIHHSWESSWHKIARIEKEGEVYLTNPFTYPVGFFSTTLHFRIENACDFFTRPGTWIFNKERKAIYYLAGKNVKVQEMEFTVPILSHLVRITGKANQKVKNITFENVKFIETVDVWGVNGLSGDERKKYEEALDWIDFSRGFSSAQAAPASGFAVGIKYGENILFNNCEFTQLGTYAVKLGEGAVRNTIQNCIIHQNGSGGLLLGESRSNISPEKYPDTWVAKGNIIQNNSIHDNGIIHPSGVGIGIMQSSGNQILNNHIYNMPYSGISLGWNWNDAFNYTKNNLIAHNHIHHVMQLLADGGGIYTLGDLTGTRIENNYIHDLYRSPFAVGATINGIFFDQASQALSVSGNLIKEIEGKSLKFNRTDASFIDFSNNLFLP